MERYDRRRQGGSVERVHQEDLRKDLGCLPSGKYAAEDRRRIPADAVLRLSHGRDRRSCEELLNPARRRRGAPPCADVRRGVDHAVHRSGEMEDEASQTRDAHRRREPRRTRVHERPPEDGRPVRPGKGRDHRGRLRGPSARLCGSDPRQARGSVRQPQADEIGPRCKEVRLPKRAERPRRGCMGSARPLHCKDRASRLPFTLSQSLKECLAHTPGGRRGGVAAYPAASGFPGGKTGRLDAEEGRPGSPPRDEKGTPMARQRPYNQTDCTR